MIRDSIEASFATRSLQVSMSVSQGTEKSKPSASSDCAAHSRKSITFTLPPFTACDTVCKLCARKDILNADISGESVTSSSTEEEG